MSVSTVFVVWDAAGDEDSTYKVTDWEFRAGALWMEREDDGGYEHVIPFSSLHHFEVYDR